MTTSSATLRLMTSLDHVDFITEALGIQPTTASIAGTPVSSRNPNGRKREESIWSLESGISEERTLDEHLEKLCAIIAEKAESLRSIRNRLDSADLFCMFSSENGQGMCSIASSTLAMLGALELELIIDLYPPTEVENNGS